MNKKSLKKQVEEIERDVHNIVRTASQQGIFSTIIKKSSDLPAAAVCRLLKTFLNLQYSKGKPALDLKTAHKEVRMKFAEEKIFWMSDWDEINFLTKKKLVLMNQMDVSTTGIICKKIQEFLKACWRRRISEGLGRS